MIIKNKFCRRCNTLKDIKEFSKSTSSKDRLKSHCKECRNYTNRKYRELKFSSKPRKISNLSAKDRERNSYYISEYNISLEDYNKLFEVQKGVCAICNKSETMKHQNGNIRNLAVDHCHITGIVRGLLCSAHNRGIGYFNDNIEYLENAIKYLKKEKAGQQKGEENP